jgi:hypothetical protein
MAPFRYTNLTSAKLNSETQQDLEVLFGAGTVRGNPQPRHGAVTTERYTPSLSTCSSPVRQLSLSDIMDFRMLLRIKGS